MTPSPSPGPDTGRAWTCNAGPGAAKPGEHAGYTRRVPSPTQNTRIRASLAAASSKGSVAHIGYACDSPILIDHAP
jgi:hypothetical protein